MALNKAAVKIKLEPDELRQVLAALSEFQTIAEKAGRNTAAVDCYALKLRLIAQSKTPETPELPGTPGAD